MSACESACDCCNPSVKFHGPHDPDCHFYDHCDEGRYCDKHLAEAEAEHAWMRGIPKSVVTGVLSDEDKQDIIDAGRGHLVRP